MGGNSKIRGRSSSLKTPEKKKTLPMRTIEQCYAITPGASIHIYICAQKNQTY